MIDGTVTVLADVPASEIEYAAENLEMKQSQSNEDVSDNEVTITAIEAEKEVAIAEINAEARVEEAKAYSENNGELEECRNRISHLEGELISMREQMSSLLNPTPQLPVSSEELAEVTEEIAEEISETLEEQNLTPQSTVDPTSSTATEVSEKSEEERVELPPVLEVAGKPIIKLV